MEDNEFEDDKENLSEAPLSPQLKGDLRRVRTSHHGEKGNPVAVRRSLSGDLMTEKTSSPMSEFLTARSTATGAF